MKRMQCLAAVFLAALSITACGSNEIEDINGANDYSLATITDSNIIKEDLGASGLKTSGNIEEEMATYSSKNFSGVERLYSTNYIGSSDVTIDVHTLSVTEGNFRLVVVLDDEIIHEFTLGELSQHLELTDIGGTLEIKAAGESAAFHCDIEIW